MSFQYPLGLLGLLGVPVLIIIYIIKSKFTEQTVSSTYLWTLSNRFLKKKRKDNKLTGLISLILQILAVVVISFTIAHPVFTLHGAAWTFVIWGAMHGVYQIIGNLTIKHRNRLVIKAGFTEQNTVVVWTRRVITFVLVAFAWIFFRANSISDAFLLLSRLFTFSGGGISETVTSMGLDIPTALLIVASIAVLIFIDRMLKYEDAPDSSDVLTRSGAFVYFVWIVLLCWTLLLSKDMISTFIYFQF